MEQSRLSFRSLSVAAILHILFLVLLFYITQSDGPLALLSPRAQETQEPSVVFMPTQAPQATIPASLPQQQVAHPHIPTEEKETAREKGIEQQEKPEEKELEHETTSRIPEPFKEPWSAERAKRAWQKIQARPQISPVGNPATTYHDGLMHKIIDGIPIEEKGVPLRQRINAQFVKDGQENYQFGIIKGICYELNKQKIMEASSNLPRKVVFKIVLERDGRLIDAQFIEASYSESFNNACLQAMHAASPYRVAPASVSGDPVTIVFTLYHDPSGIQNSNVPTPITFYVN